MAAAEAQNLVRNQGKLKSQPEKNKRNKYCRYHKDHDHETEKCFKLKIVIEKLIKRGHLAEFVHNNQPRQDDRPIEQQPVGNINVVFRGTFRDRKSVV